MAIHIKKDGDRIDISIDNGHAKSLQKVMQAYDIIDEEKTMGFILSVMEDADGKPIKTINGSFVPSEKIKKAPI